MSTSALLATKWPRLTEEQQRQVIEFIERLTPPRPDDRPTLHGLFKGYETTDEEIAEARGEMWGRFPREDFE